MNSFVSRFARGLNKLKKRSGDVFADRYHAVAVDTPAAVRNLLVYVLNNGRKHRTWLAASPDPFSSGDQFEGWADWKGADSTKRWLPRPRTWLLSEGVEETRRAHLDPREPQALRPNFSLTRIARGVRRRGRARPTATARARPGLLAAGQTGRDEGLSGWRLGRNR